jgi:uncharacterized protein YkuJ
LNEKQRVEYSNKKHQEKKKKKKKELKYSNENNKFWVLDWLQRESYNNCLKKIKKVRD